MSDEAPPDMPAPEDGNGAEASPAGRATRSAAQAAAASAPDEGTAGAAQVRSKPKRRGRRLALALLGALVVLSLAALVVAFELTAARATPQTQEFEVEPGWGAQRVAEELRARGLIRNATVFRFYLRWHGLDRAIGEGLYDLSPSLDAAAVAAALAAGGRPRTVVVVIPEGWRAVDIAARLEAFGLGSAPTFRALIAQPGSLRPSWDDSDGGLEGYLFPASYEFLQNGSPENTLQKMLARFAQELDPSTREALGARGLSVRAWVTLASMVQAEAATDGEMPIIAGVFLNRLDMGMPLQSDPTVAYGLDKALPELSAVAGDLRKDTPWNTYTRSGLPRGPIGNPGSAALRSVLEPVRRTDEGVPYLYFLHGVDAGTPVFRPNTSLDGHNRDVRVYLRGEPP